jgi:dienelactone hydrolase
MTIQNRIVDYIDEGTTLKGYLTWDDEVKGSRPAVLVAHAWGGRSEFECKKADTLARAGYVGFAIDMYGDAKQGANVEENMALMQPLIDDREALQRRIALAVDTVRGQPEVDETQVAAMGFCFGGLCVLDLARMGANVKGVVSFHGLLGAPKNTEANKITAKVLCLHGYDDPMAPPEQILEFGTEMTKAGADWQLHAYGNTQHAFTVPEANDPEMGTVYSQKAHDRSRASMLNFLDEIFA